jgi:hypothetical protein
LRRRRRRRRRQDEPGSATLGACHGRASEVREPEFPQAPGQLLLAMCQLGHNAGKLGDEGFRRRVIHGSLQQPTLLLLGLTTECAAILTRCANW